MQFVIETAGHRIRQNSGVRFGIEVSELEAGLLLASIRSEPNSGK